MPELPQIIPQSRCLRCDVCCRFPEADSPLRPFFTREEARAAVSAGLPESAFPGPDGGRIRLVPHPAGEGYLCPVFDPETNHCRIYADRPFDCRLFPFAAMRDPQGTGAVLGWDRHCPYLMNEAEPSLPLDAAREVGGVLEEGGPDSLLNRNPGLLGAHQPSVRVLTVLPSVRVPLEPPCPPLPGMEPVTDENCADLLPRADSPGPRRLSHSNLVSVLMWEPLIRFWRTDIKEGPVIVAEQGGAYFLPVPPFTPDLATAAGGALDLLDRLNRDPAASRIERIDEPGKGRLTGREWTVRPAGEEYLYRRSDLVSLPGRSRKSHRWNTNRARKRYLPRIRNWTPADLQDCTALYARWQSRKAERNPDRYAAALAEDSLYAHGNLWVNVERWNVRARVATVAGMVRAYTAGVPLSADTFLVLVEIADPDYSGLGPFLFREFCRELEGYSWINTMDDSGLASLRRTKLAYGPEARIPFFTAARATGRSVELPPVSLGRRR